MNKEVISLRFPKITVVTPNYNQGDFIEQTINSVLNQNYPNLEYIIIDGGSQDKSVEIIRKYESKLFHWVSERDSGMYHAINKGFSRATGEIMCWINSDDVLWENSLFHVSRIFNSNPQIHWLQGNPTLINKNEKVVVQNKYYFSKFHFYSFRYIKTFSFIQQESSFWSKELWERAGSHLDTNYDLAADFDLWMRFFEFEKMYCTKEQLGAFRERDGQKSGDRESYLNESKKSLAKNFKKLVLSERLIIKFILKLNTVQLPYKKKYILKLSNYITNLMVGKPKFVK